MPRSALHLAPGNSHLFQQLILKPFLFLCHNVSLSVGFLCSNSLTSAPCTRMKVWRRAGCKSRQTGARL